MRSKFHNILPLNFKYFFARILTIKNPVLAAEPHVAPAFRYYIFTFSAFRKPRIFIYWSRDDKPVTTSHDL